jgi:hypothetical protein
MWSEVTAAFERYERALVSNDLDTPMRCSATIRTIRYGATETLRL